MRGYTNTYSTGVSSPNSPSDGEVDLVHREPLDFIPHNLKHNDSTISKHTQKEGEGGANGSM
jgi:hypothetical protein